MATPTHRLWQNDPAILNAARNAPALKPGASGSGVRRLREALREMGAPASPDPPTVFGAGTREQVDAFQRLYGLDADGVAGKTTIDRLDAMLSVPRERRKPWVAKGPREEFLEEVARECGPVVRAEGQGLPVSTMLACAAVESGWGTGPIYRHTNNLFGLQKWPWTPFPRTLMTMWRPTVVQTNPVRLALAPFNVAIDMADSARQWCEWILKYGEADGPPGLQPVKGRKPAGHYPGSDGARTNRERFRRMKGDPATQADNLHLVGFGERSHGALYGRVLRENRLTRFD